MADTVNPFNCDTLAPEVAEHLTSLTGDIWKGRSHGYGLELTRERDGLHLNLDAWTRPERAEAVYYPDTARGSERRNDPLPRIGLSLAKGAGAIALDLHKRILPRAEELHARLGTRAAETAEIRREDQATGERLAALGWKERRDFGEDWVLLNPEPGRFGTVTGKVTIHGGRGAIRLDKLTRDQVERILTALAVTA